MERLKACEDLQGFSPTVSQVLKLTASASSSAEAISKAISQDQAMALKILKIANSPIYSRGDRVDTVHKAVLRIGMASIRQTVLNIGVVERFSSPAFKEHVSTQQFWEHSIACGIIAAEIAHALDVKDADSAFTSGLLHDLGRVIFAEALGEKYIQVIETARRLQAPRRSEQLRILLTAPFRPLYVSASPELDAFRIFCNELAGPPGEELPNIVVVHLTSAKECEPLAERVTAAEEAAGVGGLPLIVLSPAGQLALPDRITRTRAHRLVATPLPVSRFIAAVVELAQEASARVAA